MDFITSLFGKKKKNNERQNEISNRPSGPAEKFIHPEDVGAVPNDTRSILSCWRKVNISEEIFETSERPEEVESEEGQPSWPDPASNESAIRLRKQGIQLPWHNGDKFGDRFQVAGLRAGGLGVVFIVESAGAEGKRKYAAKTLKGFLKNDYLSLPVHQQEEIAKAFLEEALPWLQMEQHPHIVPVRLLDNVLHPEQRRNIPFVFSEYMPRGNLREYLRGKGKLEAKTCLSLGIQICSGLTHAYENGINAHLDLKPDNIMVYDEGLFKVTDFSANVIGTPAYMTPEQVALMWKNRGVNLCVSDEPIDQRADIFAVGLIMLETFFGKHPFSICYEACSQERVDRARQYVAEGVGDLGGIIVPGAIRDIFSRALSRDANRRYETIGAFRAELVQDYEKDYGKYIEPEVKKDDSAEWWFDRGRSFQQIGREAFAEAPFKEALNRFHDSNQTEVEEADCRMNLGVVYWRTSRYEEAERYTKEALFILRRVPGTETFQALCLMNLGLIYESMRNFEESEKSHQKAISIIKTIPETEEFQARCMMNTGIVYERTGRYGEAEGNFNQALSIFQMIPGNELDQARCKENLAIVYLKTGRFGVAEISSKQALTIYRKFPGTEVEQAHCMVSIGNVFMSKRQYRDAEISSNQALTIYRKFPGTEVEQARCQLTLGAVYADMGRYGEAEANFKQALTVFRLVQGTEIDQAHCSMNLGNVYESMGRYKEAEVSLKQTLTIYRMIPGSEVGQAGCQLNLGAVYASTGRYSKAEDCYKEALAVFRGIPGTETAQADCTYNLGNVYKSMGRCGKAEVSYQEALAFYLRIPGTEVSQATCTMNLGNVYYSMGQYGEAEVSYQQALKILREIQGTEVEQAGCITNLADLFFEKISNYIKAGRYAEEALKLCKQFPPEATEQIRTACKKILQGIKEKGSLQSGI